MPDTAPSLDTLVLGGGCFWCTEAVFDRVEGVVDVESGYCNGQAHQPSYEQVCSGSTDHVEVVKLRFDPARIGLRQLLEIFFVVHDPTTLNRQGNDVGTQYRSGIYTVNDAQAQQAQALIAEMAASGVYAGRPIVTEVLPLANYWPAEDYHQDYFLNHPDQGYCAFVVAPKVQKFLQTFAAHQKR